jgi:predicted permease
MRWLTDLWFRLRALFARKAMEEELDEELSFHLDMEAAKLEREGLPPGEAIRRARLAFGGEERFREKARESWGVGALDDLARDLRFSGRQLAKQRGFTALAVGTLALGIGATTALFSVVHGLMLRPLPIPDEERVVSFWSDYDWRGEEFDHVKGVPSGFHSIAAYSIDAYTLRTDAGSSLILATVASTELFDVMGVRPLLGRGLLPGEDRPGAEPVIVLGHALWTRAFGADPGVVDTRVELNGTPRRVVGVMPEGFYFPTPEVDAFVPLDLDPADPAYAGNGWLVLTGRLAEGTTEAALRSDLERIAHALGERYEYPAQWDKTRDPYAVPLREYLLGDVAPALILLLSAVGLLMLMACINVAGLILARSVDRTGEIAVRVALGAGRFRLARQILTESVLLGLVSGAIGLALAWSSFDLLVASLPITNAFQETLSLDRFTLLAGLLLALLSGSLIALVPMRGLLAGEVSSDAFRGRTQGGGGVPHRTRLQASLVVAEVLLAVVLSTGASLLVRSVDRLRAIDSGLEPAGVLTLDVLMPEASTGAEERALFLERLLARARALPGVTGVGYINRLPLRDGGWQGTVRIPDRPDLDAANRPTAMFRPVTPETFDALGIQLVEGRGVLPTDVAGGPKVAVINETFARRIWGSESPIGRTYSSGFGNVGAVEVVGVVKDVAVETLVGDQPMVGFYPWVQAMPGAAYAILVVKTSGEPSALAPALRTIVPELDPRAAIGRMETMQEALDVEMAEPLRLRFFLGLFSALGILLGTVGVYGVVSYSVERRRTEYGIRMALGANPGRLLGLVIGHGMLPVLVGVLIGSGVALLASGALAGFLFEVEPSDPVSFLAAAAALLFAGGIAALVPALRASATHPAAALRAE